MDLLISPIFKTLNHFQCEKDLFPLYGDPVMLYFAEVNHTQVKIG